ncbi:MAG: methyl-accepting chemotaxis protein, partial [Syntrophomonadaceae bacterium]|nr:methyl-accepting chemotaxis protein [Syntrophomonadaceae bacterium]
TKDLSQEMMTAEKGIKEYELAGTQLVVFRKLPSTGWVLGINLPKDVAYRDLAAVRELQVKFITIDLVVLILVACLTLLFTSRMTRPIQELVRSAETLATGDLTIKMGVVGKDEVANVSNAFNRMVDNLRSLVVQIGSSANLVSSASQEIRAAVEEQEKVSEQIAATVAELAKGASSQAGSVQKGVHLVQEMNEAIEGINGGVKVFSQMAEEVRASVEQGYEAVLNQTALMEESKQESMVVAQCIESLADKSSRIGQIVEVIGGIAEQTNLLALNAAIEAARAGEQGRGFAVVAEEVRKLAEQSARSSEEIAALIRETQVNTEQAVQEIKSTAAIMENQEKAADATKAYFDRIRGAVDEIAAYVQQVVTAANQLKVSSREVSAAIENIRSVSDESVGFSAEVAAATQEQAASVQEISRQVEKLTSEAEQLMQEIKKFTV